MKRKTFAPPGNPLNIRGFIRGKQVRFETCETPALSEGDFQVDLFISGITHMVHLASLTTAHPSGTNAPRYLF
jgi:hypothetical protein